MKRNVGVVSSFPNFPHFRMPLIPLPFGLKGLLLYYVVRTGSSIRTKNKMALQGVKKRTLGKGPKAVKRFNNSIHLTQNFSIAVLVPLQLTALDKD